MNHLTEKEIVLYILNAAAATARREEMEQHFNECAGCASLYNELKEYYAEVDEVRDQRLLKEKTSLVVVERLLSRRIAQDRIAIRNFEVGIARRAVDFVRARPVVSSIGFIALAALLALIYPRTVLRDTDLAYARAKDEFLVAYNKNGDELWRKHEGIGFDHESIGRYDPQVSEDQYFKVVDVDNNSKNAVIAMFGWMDQPLAAERNAIVCYGSDGAERWRFKLNRSMTFGDERFADDYRFVKILVGDFEGNGKTEVVAAAMQTPYYPCVLVRLDARTGTLLDEYWHPGTSNKLYSWTLGDDVRYLFSAGCNNGFNQAHIVVLDPRTMTGHAPAPPSYSPVGIPEGREKYYILLPRSDVSILSHDKRNDVRLIRPTPDSLFEVFVREIPTMKPSPEVIYYFDRSMKCVRVIGDDHFEEAWRKLIAEGKIKKSLEEQYEELRLGVRYWDGENFVSGPMMNRRSVNVSDSKMVP